METTLIVRANGGETIGSLVATKEQLRDNMVDSNGTFEALIYPKPNSSLD
jgi:hypothetical protein